MQARRRTYHPPEIPPANTPEPGRLPAPDMLQARRDAERTLAELDLTRQVIVLWLPGTNRSGIPVTFSAPAHAAWGAYLSLAELRYPASLDVRRGVATGIATLEIVLAAIAASGRHIVHVAGESQGSWVITEVLSNPRMRRIVDRAALLSNPWPASHHYVDGHDPRVLELDRRVDLVARRINGNVNDALEAAEGVLRFDLRAIPKLLKVAWNNPGSALLLASTGLRLLTPGGRDRDPHNYEDMMPGAVRFLHVGWQPEPAESRLQMAATQHRLSSRRRSKGPRLAQQVRSSGHAARRTPG